MATKQPLKVIERNDEVVTVTATRNGTPIDLTGLGVEAVVKGDASVDDSTGTTLTLAAGDVEVTDAAGGVFDVHYPATALTSPGIKFYRVDLLDGTLRHTLLYGDLTIVDV